MWEAASRRRLEIEQVSLAHWVKQCMVEGTLDIVIDPFVRGQIAPQCLDNFAKLAKACLEQSSKNQPTMGGVLKRLELTLVCQTNYCHGRESDDSGSSSALNA
ncbi:hypothetical protein Vadar_025842 [Vaccinium darrowii]|uniref:Uncharacterized protein n=1 Tax=Vaccinium darrowii TaxID=229202 RepID=A0ACB7ZFA1_9ERIC|nr:hypothetical protein Vadar_025842 [Vaccinium darrowii]